MGCSTCKTADGKVAGCKSNGGCQTGGCNKMNVFDWLSNMDAPTFDLFDIVEIRFKNGRKEFFKNAEKIILHPGDAVVVDVPNGHHIGHVSLQGELVRLQMRKKGVENDENIRPIYRIATQKDLEKYERVQNREMPTLYRTREIISDLKLEMKLTDVEYFADNTKATFYYSAEERVDFRELIKILAGEFKIRVEMRQISLRQEAGRLGGIGSCGRELCCSTWLSDFKSVTTQAARYQNLSLNPSKLSGQCGRLKCCLNYELDTYVEALEDIPEVEKPLQTEKGAAKLQKTDIFRKVMWFGYDDEATWHPVPAERVSEIIEMNAKGEKPVTLLENESALDIEAGGSLNSDLIEMDKKFNHGQKKKSKKKRKNRNRNFPDNKQKNKPQNNPQNKAGKNQRGNNKKKRNHNPNKNKPNKN